MDSRGRPRGQQEPPKTFNEAGITGREFAARTAFFTLFWIWSLAQSVTGLVALFVGDWQYGLLLLVASVFLKAYRGLVFLAYLGYAALFGIGVVTGHASLAFFGVLVPESARLVMLLAFGSRYGVPKIIFWRAPYPPKDDAAKGREVRLYKLRGWQEKIGRAPTDRDTLEHAVFEMRDWAMTPSQAKRVARRAGAPRALVEDIVENVVLWPNIGQAKSIEIGWRWERTIEAEASSPGAEESGGGP